jgi:hypothetical protein
MSSEHPADAAAILVRRLVDCLYTLSSREWQRQVWFCDHPMGYVDSFDDASQELEYLVEYLLEPELLEAAKLTEKDLATLQLLDESVGAIIDEREDKPFDYETSQLDLHWKDVMRDAASALQLMEKRTGLKPSISVDDRPSTSSG